MKGQQGYKIRTIVCAGCGKTHTGHLRPQQRYCSAACYRRSPHPNHERRFDTACAWCGKALRIHEHRKGRPRYFCDKACADAWQGRHKTAHTCIICGVEFRWSPSRTASGKYNVKYCSLACRDADPERKAMLVHMNQRQAHTRINGLERRGYELLDEVGSRYIKQHLIGDKFCVDAFLPDHGLVIQFDGDYWHGNPDRFPDPDERQQKRMRRDTSQDAYMTACGYEVLRFWEHEVKRSPDAVITQLRAAVARREGWQPPRRTSRREAAAGR